MCRVHGQANEHGSQHGEDVGLNQGYDNLQNHDADRNENRYRSNPDRDNQPDQTEQNGNDRMAGEHIGKETNGQRERPDHEAHDLNDNDERHEPQRYSGRRERMQKTADAVLLDSHADHEHERTECQACGDIDIARSGRSPWQQAQQVCEQNAGEQRQEVREEGIGLAVQVGPKDFIANEHDEDFKRVAQARGNRRLLPRSEDDHNEYEENSNCPPDLMLRDEVKVADLERGQMDGESEQVELVGINEVMREDVNERGSHAFFRVCSLTGGVRFRRRTGVERIHDGMFLREERQAQPEKYNNSQMFEEGQPELNYEVFCEIQREILKSK